MREWSKRVLKVSVGFAAMFLLFSKSDLTSFAQPPNEIALNEQILSHFAQTWEPITDTVSAFDKEFDRTHLPSLLHSLSVLSASDGTHSPLDEAVSTFGYVDFEHWASIASDSIAAAQWALQPPTLVELNRTIASLQADPDISADQKQSLVNDVSAAFQTALDNKPSEANIAAAKAVLPLLEPIIKPDQ